MTSALDPDVRAYKQCRGKTADSAWRAFCHSEAIGQMWGEAVLVTEQLKEDANSNSMSKAKSGEVAVLTQGWPETLIAGCAREGESCVSARLLRYMAKTTAAIADVNKAKLAKPPAVSPELAEKADKKLETLIGSYKTAKHKLHLIRVRKGVMFFEAEESGPYDPTIKMSGSACRYVMAAYPLENGDFEGKIAAFTAPACRLRIGTLAGKLWIKTLDESCQDFCGMNVDMKNFTLDLKERKPAKDLEWMKNLDEYKAAL